ncbi:hypothetical protein ABH929_003623 [Curtobacterium sp. AB7]
MSGPMATERQRRHDPRGVAAPHLNRGRSVTLLRWRHTADGWVYETRVGVYLGSTPEFLLLEVDGVERAFNRDQWMVVSR